MSYQTAIRAISLTIAAAAAWTAPTGADQTPSPSARALTTADYAHAEKFMTWNTTPLVFRSNVSPTWLPDDRFWYRVTTAAGNDAIIVNPATGDKQPCSLPACTVSAAEGGRGGGGRGRGGRGGRGAGAVPSVTSPDGKHAVFIRDWNLWIRDSDSAKESPLTTDGIKDFGYATDNAGWSKSDRPIVVWSPDSKKIATFQQDQRGVGEMYLVSTQVGHPQLQAWKYPLPGDETVAMLHRVVMHRIVAIQNGHYTLKGDNNSFTDPEQPTRADLVGKEAIHLPAAGNALRWLRRPWILALLAAVAVLTLGVDIRRDHSAEATADEATP